MADHKEDSEKFEESLLEEFQVEELEERFEFAACCNIGSCNEGCTPEVESA